MGNEERKGKNCPDKAVPLKEGVMAKRIEELESQLLQSRKREQELLIALEQACEFKGKLEQEVLIDPLTGLFNRRGLEQIVPGMYSDASRHKFLFGFLFIDLDGFKLLNDARGHEQGDLALKKFGGILQACLRKEDMVFRYGGDEFVVAMKMVDLQYFFGLVQRLQSFEQVKMTRLYDEFGLGASIGGAFIQFGSTKMADSCVRYTFGLRLKEGFIHQVQETVGKRMGTCQIGGWQNVLKVADQKMYSVKQLKDCLYHPNRG